MSYRFGRGRGRGAPYVKTEPFVLFPDIDLPDAKSIPEERGLTIWNSKLQSFWKESAYHLEETVTKKSQSMDIERFSDWGKQNTKLRRDSLYRYLVLESHNFPKELIGGAKRVQRAPEEVRWNPDAGLRKLDLFEKLEDKSKGQEEKDGKKEGAENEEAEDELGEEVEEESSEGDYDQNFDFDDDEDDYNMDDDGNDEPMY